MPNGGSDCCGTCPFNKVSPSGEQYHFCEIRDFKIEIPYWTYCNNHPRRNPLLLRTPRGPIWAPAYVDLDSKPFSEDLKIPPEILPPAGDAMYVRIPYYQNTRPDTDEAGVCVICGEQCERTISLEPLGEDKKFFCSTAHYFEWWLASPEAIPYRNKSSLGAGSINEKLGEISKKLSDAGIALRTTGDREQVMGRLAELDNLLLELGYGSVDLMHAMIYLENPELSGELSPHLLRLQVYLSRAGGLLQQEPLDAEAILASLSDIQNTIQRFLSGNP